MRLPLLPVLLAGTLLSAGCQKSADAAAEAALERASGRELQLDRNGGHTRIRTADGEVVVAAGDAVALPADFADDLFLPATYAVSSVMEVGGARLVNLESEGSLASMFDAARAAMAAKGWTQTLAMQQPDSAMLGFSKGAREVTYTFTKRGDAHLVIGIQLRGRPDRR